MGIVMVKAAILITTSPGKVDEVASKIKEIKNISDILIVTGRVDIVVLCEGSLEEISTITKKIGEIREVETTETLIELVS
jgi:DNA-binding Lrp family transcriptional regulator